MTQAAPASPTHDLRITPFPVAFAPGARNAVETCLRIQPSEKVTVITDEKCISIAASLAAELDRNGCTWHSFVLEDIAQRPLTDMPPEVLADMETSQVSIFAVQVQANDFAAVDRLSQRVIELARKAQVVRATTAAGTSISAQMHPGYKWLKTSGIISPDKWGNLPGGEIFTSPGEVNGTFVVDGVVGDYLCARYGILDKTPLTIQIAKNRITACTSPDKLLEAEFWEYTHRDENSDRVGEFAIGTNIGLSALIGNILQDEKFPGIHIAFGDPYGAHTGAPWTSTTHIDVVGQRFNIWLDDLQIMREGKFLIEA
jgi:leucyl aminopeptidase (aminopeptidase T)